MLMYVRRLNNYQNSLLPTFLWFFLDFWFFKIFPFLQIFLNGFFDHVRKFLQTAFSTTCANFCKCVLACSQLHTGGKNSPERCQMNLSYSPVIFTKSSKMMFLCHFKLQNHFRTQIRFDKWYWMIETCSFLTTSWNFMLMYVRRLNNYQNCLLSPFLWFFMIFPFFNFWNFFKRLFRPRAQISANGFFDNVRKFLQMCACMLTQVSILTLVYLLF